MDQVVAFDFVRMFFGDQPPLFLLEITIRTIIIYLYTFVLIRWIGSRSIAQLSLVEFLLVIALGSAVGDAMFYPDVPLVHAMIVITVIILLDKMLGFAISRSARLEDMIEGRSVEVVRDGLIKCAALEALHFGHDELFEQLRLKDIRHLGQVSAAYFETNGLLSVFRVEPGSERSGLSIEPPWDVSQPQEIKAGTKCPVAGSIVCTRCAHVDQGSTAGELVPECPNCTGTIWHRLEPPKPK